MIDADSLLTKTTISTALAFKGNQASAFGYFAKVFKIAKKNASDLMRFFIY